MIYFTIINELIEEFPLFMKLFCMIIRCWSWLSVCHWWNLSVTLLNASFPHWQVKETRAFLSVCVTGDVFRQLFSVALHTFSWPRDCDVRNIRSSLNSFENPLIRSNLPFQHDSKSHFIYICECSSDHLCKAFIFLNLSLFPNVP